MSLSLGECKDQCVNIGQTTVQTRRTWATEAGGGGGGENTGGDSDSWTLNLVLPQTGISGLEQVSSLLLATAASRNSLWVRITRL